MRRRSLGTVALPSLIAALLLAVGLAGACGTGAVRLPSDSRAVTQTATSGTASGDYVATDFDADRYPDYVRVVGSADVFGQPAAGETVYGGLDGLGRTTSVVATVTYDMVEESAGWREEFSDDDDPSGWGHNGRTTITFADGTSYHGWFWNRSHLLADSLGGHARRDNLVTGTRMQNVGENDGKGGMAYIETIVRDYLRDHHDVTVYYRATPVYMGDELVPRSVYVDAKSSDGAIDTEVETFNAAAGHSIDYATGDWD